MFKFLFSSPYMNYRRGEKKYALKQMAFSMVLTGVIVTYNVMKEREARLMPANIDALRKGGYIK